MKHKLYDFSPFAAVATVLLCLLFLILFGAAFFGGHFAPFPGVIFVLLCLLTFYILFHFVLHAAYYTEHEIVHGKKRIARENLTCDIFYNRRYKEIQIELSDKTVKKTPSADSALSKDCIYLQATNANLKKLSAYLGYELVIPEEARRKGRSRKKQ